ncbi:hypothetical protein [Streptomyces sp. NPDC001851]|uniref:hypothetical protein n=1 Tax=Streptomyces sp. NPDC001851 TaxID=3154529 RepID=UPI00332C5EBC
MESRVQQMLRERRETAALAETEDRLGELRGGGALLADAVPAWVGRSVGRSRSICTEPYDRLPDDTPPAQLDTWIEELLIAQGVTGRVLVASHLGILPWLECRLPARGWMARVREAIEEPWMFLSQTLDALVIVSESEYFYEAHLSRDAS